MKLNMFNILLLIVLMCSCNQKSKEIDLSNQLTYSNKITALLADNKLTSIDIDNLKVDSIKKSLIIGKFEENITNIENFLVNPYSCWNKNDSLIIVDAGANCLYITNDKGEIIRKIGRKGNGPGEFIQPSFIVANSNKFAIYNNNGIIIIDKNFNYLTKLNALFGPFGSCMALTESKLYTISSDPQRFSSIDIYNMTDSNIGTFDSFIELPMIVPFGKQPIGMNKIVIAANNEFIFCSYSGLPYVFIFDHAKKHIQTIEINGKILSNRLKNISINDPDPEKIFVAIIINTLVVDKDKLFILLPDRYLLMININTNSIISNPKLHMLKYEKDLNPTNLFYSNNSIIACYIDAQVVKYSLNYN